MPVGVPGRRSVVCMTSCVRTINPGSPFDHIEIDLQDALLAKKELGDGHQCELGAFAEDRAAGSEEEVFYKLLCNRGSSAGAAAFPILVSSDLDLVPVEAMVLVETRVFRGNDSVLKIGRDLTERNKFVSFVIRRVVDPSLYAALGLHRSGRWIDPPGSHNEQRDQQPERRHTNDKPWNQESEDILAR